MSKCLDQCEHFLENILVVQSLQWPTFVPSEYIAELDIIAALKKQLEDKRGKVRPDGVCEMLPVPSRSVDWCIK